MVDFSHLKNLEQKGDKQFPYVLEQIEGAPTIWFHPATDANKDFLNESLRRVNARAGQNRRGRRVTEEVVRASRDEDREVFAQVCAKRWTVKDANGEDVEFTADNCLSFFRALPDWLFDDIRTWLTNPANFVDNPNGNALGEALPLG